MQWKTGDALFFVGFWVRFGLGLRLKGHRYLNLNPHISNLFNDTLTFSLAEKVRNINESLRTLWKPRESHDFDGGAGSELGQHSHLGRGTGGLLRRLLHDVPPLRGQTRRLTKNIPFYSHARKRKRGDHLNPGTTIGIITGLVIILLLFVLSIIAWELFRRDYQ